MIPQSDALPDENDVKHLKQDEKSKCDQTMKRKSERIEQALFRTLLHAVNDAREPGASNWLSLCRWNNMVLFQGDSCGLYATRLHGRTFFIIW